jgi:hypothetical protein
MVLDLGIHLDYLGSAGYRGLTPEEKESRRLIWVRPPLVLCYTYNGGRY